jgi:hydroxypyruvate isomerase
MKRRNVLKSLAITAGAVATGQQLCAGAKEAAGLPLALKGNINHSVARWTYGSLPLEELCQVVKQIGFSAIDLLAPKDWPIAQQYGIYSSMCYIDGEVSLVKGFNDKQYHAALTKAYLDVMPLMKKAGYTNLICFSGNRNGMADETGMKNCAEGLQPLVRAAEQYGITLQMELFNSRIDHKDYMCDKSEWGIALCKMIGSPNFKLLFDIYHMQINEGDIIRSIQNNHAYFGHYHTAGVPGRHEINDSQELNYPAIMKAIAATGYKGYVAQEFMPTGTSKAAQIAALQYAIEKCDV